jgi:nitrogenase molybdenum-iron protein alpha/beta subunit
MSKKITFNIPTESVKIPASGKNKEQSFEVRGASLPDVSKVMQEHGEAMAMLYARFSDDSMDVSDKKLAGAIATLLADMPKLCATVISLCADSAVEPEVALRLPLPVQAESLMQISRLTFVGEGAVGKFIAVATEMLKGVAGAMAEIKAPPDNGQTT